MQDNRPQPQGFPSASEPAKLLRTGREGGEACCRQTVLPAGSGLASLYVTVLGFDCITTGCAYAQGIGGSLLSILRARPALSGPTATILSVRLRGHDGLVTAGVTSSWLHVGCLMVCVFSVFAPGSPFDLAVFSLPSSHNSSSNHGMLKEGQVHAYSFERNMNQPILPDRSSIHWTNSTVLFEGEQAPGILNLISISPCSSGARSWQESVSSGPCVPWDSADCAVAT